MDDAYRRYPQKSPRSVLDDAEEQWRFTEAELAQAPSIRDGMRQVDELDTRAKCVQFIIQAGIIAQLPVSTITTATTFFHRFLMRKSLKRRVNGERALSPYEIGATALFLATKVEESCRKLQVLASAFFCAAHQNMEITYDDQSHDWWHWAECVLDNEDALLETLCFDLLIGSPHNQLQAMMEACGIERDRDLRHAACAFYAGTVKTPLCLLLGSHTIAAAGLYAACLHCEKSLPDKDGHPWWQPHRVDIKTLRWAVKYMCDVYHAAPHRLKGADLHRFEGSVPSFSRLSTLLDNMDSSTSVADPTRGPYTPPASSRKRGHHDGPVSGKSSPLEDGVKRRRTDATPDSTLRTNGDAMHVEEKIRVQDGNAGSAEAVNGESAPVNGEAAPTPGSSVPEEGEVIG